MVDNKNILIKNYLHKKIQAIPTTKDYCPGLMKHDPTHVIAFL